MPTDDLGAPTSRTDDPRAKGAAALVRTSGVLGRQISLVVVGDAITVVSTLLAGMFLARLMPPADMGTYRQVLYLGLMATTLAEMGLGPSVYRFWNALDEDGRRVYARMLVTSTLILGSLATGALAVLSGHLAIWYKNADLRLALLIAAPYPLSAIPIQCLRPVLISRGESLKATVLETLFSMTAILSVAVPVALGAKLTTALVFWIVACLARVLVVPALLREYLAGTGPWWHRGLASDVWSYLWPIQMSRGPAVLTTYLDQVVMSFSLSPRAFAVYSMGARELPLVGMVGPSVSSVLIPHLVEDVTQGRTDQICRRWRRASLTTALLTYPAAAFCILYAGPVMQLLFSATYRESSVPFRVFAAITFIRVVEYASLAKAYNQTAIILKSSVCAAALIAGLAVPLTARFGAVGMASAVLVGTAAAASYMLGTYGKLLDRPLTRFFPWPHLAVLAASALILAGCSSWLASTVAPIWDRDGASSLVWKLGLHLGAYAALYATAMVVTARVWPAFLAAELRALLGIGRQIVGVRA